jgi:hypothetical protein
MTDITQTHSSKPKNCDLAVDHRRIPAYSTTSAGGIRKGGLPANFQEIKPMCFNYQHKELQRHRFPKGLIMKEIAAGLGLRIGGKGHGKSELNVARQYHSLNLLRLTFTSEGLDGDA